MNGFLVDTNGISEYTKPLPNPGLMDWFRNADPQTLFVSAITFGELRRGIENLAPGKRRTELERWLSFGLPEWFSPNLLPITKSIADRWGVLDIQARRAGATLSTTDGLIAATASHHGLTVITRNTRHFTGLGIDLLNPWT